MPQRSRRSGSSGQQKPDKFSRSNTMRQRLDAFGNIFALNLCFVIGSLPVFTIGASLTAAYSTAMRLQEEQEETVVAGFIHEYKKNFKQATLAFLLVMAAAAVLFAEILVINTQKGFISIFYTVVFYAELLMVSLVLAFLFPLIARYENTVINYIKNAFLLSVGYVGSWLKIVIAWVAPIYFSIRYPVIFAMTWYLWLLIIFGAIIYGTSFTVRHVFKMNQEA